MYTFSMIHRKEAEYGIHANDRLDLELVWWLWSDISYYNFVFHLHMLIPQKQLLIRLIEIIC